MPKYKILIVDDEQDLVKAIKARLESEGYAISVAYEGIRAVEMAHRKFPDLIILDLKMPAGTGQSVLKNLKAQADTEHIPVIVLTALAGSEIEKEVREAGAQDFIRKPYDSQRLLQAVKRALSKEEENER